VVIIGMMANKDASAFLANFAGLTRHIMAVPIPGRDNAMPPDRLADAARALGMRVESAASFEAALGSLARLAYEVPAAHPDHGLAVPRRSRAIRQRHTAGITENGNGRLSPRRQNQICLRQALRPQP